MAVVELFRALGDPCRLEMIERLSNGKMHTISSLSEGLDISRQGARKHLQILAEAHLIVLESQGRKTTVRLDREVFDKGREFIVELELQWDKRLGALRELLEPPTGKIVENRTR